MAVTDVEFALDERFGRYADLSRLVTEQAGVVSRAQVIELGMTDEAIESNLAGRRWQHIHPGVYAAFTGSPPELARVWAGLLWAGEGAVLARSTALRGYGFIRIPDAGVVHILVDHARKVRDIAGVSVRRRRDLQRFVHPAKRPPTVRLEDAVLHEAAGPDSSNRRPSTHRRRVSGPSDGAGTVAGNAG
jgi:hypothetical protein